MPEVVEDVEGNPVDVEGTPAAEEPATSAPEEGNDQDASEGTDVPEVTESQVNDAPEPENDEGE